MHFNLPTRKFCRKTKSNIYILNQISIEHCWYNWCVSFLTISNLHRRTWCILIFKYRFPFSKCQQRHKLHTISTNRSFLMFEFVNPSINIKRNILLWAYSKLSLVILMSWSMRYKRCKNTLKYSFFLLKRIANIWLSEREIKDIGNCAYNILSLGRFCISSASYCFKKNITY